MKNPFTYTLLVLLSVLIYMPTPFCHAQTADINIPAVCVRVSSLADLDDGYYMVGGIDYKGDFHFMSNTVDKKKLLATASCAFEEEVECDDVNLLWHIDLLNENTAVLSAADGSHIYVEKKNETNLSLEADKETQWSVAEENGGFVLANAENAERYLAISLAAKCTFGHFKEGGCDTKVLYFYRCGEPLDATIDSLVTDSKRKVLSGRWSSQRLSQVDWTGITSLDLRNAELPAYPRVFTSRHKNSNTPIYVSANQESKVADLWPFTICCDGNENRLLGNTDLKDQQPLFLEWPFNLSSFSLDYSREAYTDGGWETLYLPFEVSVPNGFVAEVLEELAYNEISFREVDVIPAYTPAILRYTGTTASGYATFSVTANALLQVDVAPQNTSSSGFFGTLDFLEVADTSEGIYMLSADGSEFVRAAAGSTLSPFRAYLRLPVGEARVKVHHDGSTSITSCTDKNAIECHRYRIDGRIATPGDKGFLIENRRKIWRK